MNEKKQYFWYNTNYKRGETMKDKLLKLLENSYSVYSHFPVAAIVVAKDGREFNGVNVEDASTRAGSCADGSSGSRRTCHLKHYTGHR